MEFLIGMVAGILIGWHFPAPAWAVMIMDKIKEKIGMK